MAKTGPTGLTETQREQRLLLVAELDRKGYNQYQIAEAVGCSQPMVSVYLRNIRRQYHEENMESHHALMVMQIASYRDVIREAWEAWEKSKKDIVDVKKRSTLVSPPPKMTIDKEGRKTYTPSGKAEMKVVEVVVDTKGRLPDPNYLKTICQAHKEIADLLGLAAPKKINARVNGGAGLWEALCNMVPDGEVPDEVEERIRAAERATKAEEETEVIVVPKSAGNGGVAGNGKED